MNLRLNNISSIYSNRPQKRQTLGVSVPFGRDESSVDGSESQNTTTVEVGKDKYIVETTTSPAGNVIRKIHKDQYEQKYREESFYDEKTPWDLPKHRSETIFDTEGNILENTNYQHNGSRIESEYKKFVIAQKTTNKIMHMRCYDSRNNLLSETNWVFNNDENQTNYYKDEEIEYYPTMGKKKKTVTTYNPDEINNVAINIKNYNEDGRTLKSETTFSSSKTIRKILNGKEVYIDAFDIKTVRIKADPEIEEVFKDGKLVKKTIFADDGSKRVFTVENRKVVAYSDYDKDDELIGTKIVTRLGEDSAPSFKGTRNAGEGKVEIKPDGRRIETITSTNGKMKTITTKDKFNRLISKKTTAYGTTTTITYDNNQNQQLIETTYPNGLKTSCEYKTFCKKGEEPRTLPMVNRAYQDGELISLEIRTTKNENTDENYHVAKKMYLDTETGTKTVSEFNPDEHNNVLVKLVRRNKRGEIEYQEEYASTKKKAKAIPVKGQAHMRRIWVNTFNVKTITTLSEDGTKTVQICDDEGTGGRPEKIMESK